jgi:hypothetical protein
LLGTSDRGTSNGFPSQFQPSFFAKPPFRSHLFVGDTVLLIVTLSIPGFDLFPQLGKNLSGK